MPHLPATLLAAALGLALLAPPARAEIKTQSVEYQHGDTKLVGYLAYDDAAKEKRPAVIVVHEWWGLNDYARLRARKLAELGYVGFAADMYGEGKTTTKSEQAAAWAGAVRKDPKLARERIALALATVRKVEQVDPARVAAIGYCFGGSTVLELARSGAELAGVVSFHGGLGTSQPAEAGQVKARVLVCHGAEDTFISEEEMRGFQKEMRQARVDWQLLSYGGAVHSFTNPDAGKAGMPGVAYHEKADQRSWRHMLDFLKELFAR